MNVAKRAVLCFVYAMAKELIEADSGFLQQHTEPGPKRLSAIGGTVSANCSWMPYSTAGARHGWPRRSSRDRREPVPGKRKYNRGRTLCGNDPVAAAAVGGAVAGVAVGGGVAVCGGAAVVPHRNYDRRILGSWAFRMLQRSTGELRLIHVPRRNEATLMPIILRHVAPGTQVYSDEWAAYRNIKRAGQNYLYDHRTVNSLNRQV